MIQSNKILFSINTELNSRLIKEEINKKQEALATLDCGEIFNNNFNFNQEDLSRLQTLYKLIKEEKGENQKGENSFNFNPTHTTMNNELLNHSGNFSNSFNYQEGVDANAPRYSHNNTLSNLLRDDNLRKSEHIKQYLLDFLSLLSKGNGILLNQLNSKLSYGGLNPMTTMQFHNLLNTLLLNKQHEEFQDDDLETIKTILSMYNSYIINSISPINNNGIDNSLLKECENNMNGSQKTNQENHNIQNYENFNILNLLCNNNTSTDNQADSMGI